MRLMTIPSAIHVAVWQELYFRWCHLTEMTIRMTVDTNADGVDNGTGPTGDKALSVEVRRSGFYDSTIEAQVSISRIGMQHGRTSLCSFLRSARPVLATSTTLPLSPK